MEEAVMKGHWISIGGLAITLLAGSSIALAEPSLSRQSMRAQMSCRDFLRLEDQAKPEIVFFLATRGEPRNSPLLDVEVTDTLVPAIVERCKDAPTTSLLFQVRAETKRLERKL
jgi:hypothetical protein